MSSNELLLATEYLEKEKKIPREVLIDAIEAALITAYKKNYDSARNVRVELNMDEGSFRVIARKEVVEEVFDDRDEVDLSTALVKNPAYEVGDIYEQDVTPKDFGRVGAQAAKQAVMQRLRDAEREILYDEFIDKEEDILTGVIDRVDHRYVYVNLGRIEAVLSEAERSPNEKYIPNERIKVYVNKVEQTTKGPQIYVSRSHPGLLKRLFEQEVPEIYDGTVIVKSVAREAGDRSKISVYSDNPDIDAVGACVGSKGARVEAVVEELGGEKIDIVQWDEDPKVFVRNALSPSQVLEVIVDEENQSTVVVVPDYQLSLAIGKRGQNARLAAKLTSWKIDIKSESDAREAGIYPVIESEEVADEIVNSGDEDVEFDNVNLEETNLTSTELAAETDEDKKDKTEEATLQEFLRKTQRAVCQSVAKNFANHYDLIMRGIYHNEIIIEDCDEVKCFQALKNFSRAYVFQTKTILDQEVLGFNIINRLLDEFVPVVLKYEKVSMNKYEERIFNNISESAKALYRREAKNATEAEKDYYRLKMAVDFVCNMTDGYAKKVYDTLFT